MIIRTLIRNVHSNHESLLRALTSVGGKETGILSTEVDRRQSAASTRQSLVATQERRAGHSVPRMIW